MSQVRLLDHVLRYKGRFAAGLLCQLSASFIIMQPPVLIQRAIDAIASGSPDTNLLLFALAILGLALAESAVRYTARRLISGTSRWVEYDLRTALAEQLMRLDQSFYLRAQTGDLMARATNDLQRVRDLLGPSLLDLFRLPTMMAFGFVLMLSIDGGLALLAIAYFPLIALVIITLRTTMEARYRAVQDQFGALTIRVQENISGVRTIKAYGQEQAEIAAFARANQEMVNRAMSWARYSAVLMALTSTAGGVSLALVLWFGGHKVVDGQLTVGQFVQFIAYLAILANPVLSLGWTVSIVQQGIAGWQRVKEVLEQTPAVVDLPQARPHLALSARVDGSQPRSARAETGPPRTPTGRPGLKVEFRNVTFGYAHRPVVSNVSFTAPAGATVGIVGETGAGKSTLVNLLVRLYDPWEGQVLLDGVDVREIPLTQLRAAVGVAPQESFLFSEPLRENLTFGVSELRDGELERALAASQLANDLPQLVDGLDTVVGERGVTLSGGQKQRAALARALLKQSPVLVLDDALSHVDTHTEEEILRRLVGFLRQRTTLLIAHRPSTLAAADFIVALDGGRIAEMGAPHELLAREGVYARLMRRQQLEEELRARNGETVADGRA